MNMKTHLPPHNSKAQQYSARKHKSEGTELNPPPCRGTPTTPKKQDPGPSTPMGHANHPTLATFHTKGGLSSLCP